ncbi:Sugar transporter ERD6-like 6 [Glycine soja]|uniref:Sugar transporter ERD6-like 6 n=1 Tax=Glycine soja TaxID=3848 RepID=A0A0B2RHK3_GLYSO|nr:Sugar transporter ERD6-like 6 [Glycine soja]
MVGAIASGQIAECIGRKGSLMIAAIPNIIGWLAISFAKDSSFLYMGRLLEGFGVGIISYVVLVYIAEIAPQNLRGGLGSVNQICGFNGKKSCNPICRSQEEKIGFSLGLGPIPWLITSEELLELGEAVGTQSRGLTQEYISSLPVSKYKCGFFSRKKSRDER